MMNTRWVLNIAFLVFINVLIKPFYVLIVDRGVQIELGDAEYGLFFTLFNFSFLFQMIADAGLLNYNSKTIAQNRSLASDYIPKIIGLKMVLGLLFLVCLMLGGIFMEYPRRYYYILAVIGLNQVLISMILYLRSNIAALGYFTLDSFLSVLDKLILTLILVYYLWYASDGVFSIYHFIWSQTASLVITLLVVFYFIIKKVSLRNIGLDLSFSKKILRESMPYALIILLMMSYTRMDGIMLERILMDDAVESGIYAKSYRLLEAANMIGVLVAGLLIPMLSYQLAKHIDIKPLLTTMSKSMIFVTVIAALCSIFFGFQIMEIMYPQSDIYYNYEIFRILMLSFIPIGMGYVLGPYFNAAGLITRLNYIFIIGIIINFSINYWIIPYEKALGAAKATLITQWVVFGIQALLCLKKLDYKFHIPSIANLFLNVGFWILIFKIISSNISVFWVYQMVISIMLSILLSLTLGFLDLRPILSFWKRKNQ